MNEAIAADMYEDLEEKMNPLAHASCETLSRYRHLSVNNTIMDGNILDTGEFEVMLSRGLGRHFAEEEKQNLFQDAKKIADFLIAVMDRKTQEEKEGKQQSQPHMHYPLSSEKIKKGLEELAWAKHLQKDLQWLVEGKRLRPGLKRLTPEDLPDGVTASRGYDHRGHCLIFEHITLGELGRIVLIKIDEGQMLMQAELHTGQENLESPLVKKKKKVFGKVVATVNRCYDENFPE